MKNLTLKISDIQILQDIQRSLFEHHPLTKKQEKKLSFFLSQLPHPDVLITEKVPLYEQFKVKLWDLNEIDKCLDQWRRLFDNLPGWDYCPFSFLVGNDNPDLLNGGVIIVARFAPSYAYNFIKSDRERAYEIRLKDDGTALFQLPTFADAKLYHELYNFRGAWKEAYLLLIETLKKGWPMEEFPEELQQFLKK